MKKLKGVIRADIIEVRFAYSGRVVAVNLKAGDIVKLGTIIASLDRREMQAQLDKELADYERARAEFEIFALDHPNPTDPKVKYAKTQQQALLNSSVKAVEISKMRLDSANLISPVTGIITSTGNLHPTMYVTSSSNPVQILDDHSFYFSVQVDSNQIINFPTNKKLKIKLDNIKETLEGTVLPLIPIPGKLGQYEIRLALPQNPLLLVGISGHLD